MSLAPDRAAALVAAASKGSRSAWEELVDAYFGLIWSIARNHRLSDGDAHDVNQTTWLRLVEHIDRLSDPSRVGPWLATTARRESLRVLRQAKRQVLLAEWEDGEVPDLIDLTNIDVGAAVIQAEQAEEVRAALQQLTPRDQALMGLLMLDPAPSYEEVSAALGMPVGSIGPTRGRCLVRLRAIIDSRSAADAS